MSFLAHDDGMNSKDTLVMPLQFILQHLSKSLFYYLLGKDSCFHIDRITKIMLKNKHQRTSLFIIILMFVNRQ